MPWIRSVVVPLVTIASCLIQTPILHGAEEPVQFKTVSLDDLFGGPPSGMNVDRYFPHDIDIPSIYTGHQNPDWAGEMIWSTDSDFERITQEGKPLQEHGFFRVKVSMNFGYDAASKKFTDFQGMHESNIAETFAKQGLQVTEVKRYTVNGFPILIIEGQQDETRKMRIVYVATKVETNVLFIYYVHPDPWSAWDEEVWGRFKSTLLESPQLGKLDGVLKSLKTGKTEDSKSN